MGIFDGYLILSDIDGTFADGKDAENINIPAVKYFTNNGGLFTFATGRLVEHLWEKGFAEIINAPAALGNGSLIYDYKTGKTIHESRLEYTVREFIDAILPIAPDEMTVQLFGIVIDNVPVYDIISPYDWLDIFEKHPDVAEARVLKTVCRFKNALEADTFRAAAEALPFFANTCITKSWSVGVEFNSIDGTKGTAVEYMKKILPGVRRVVAIGDYDNDRAMLERADISAAPASASAQIKELADIVVAHVSEGAVKDLIERLEKMILSGNTEL